ncbi:hypothetical protein HY358_01705 [Candidatus Roizmanbacteria bacterium]|nr:hypothetical protein [Candidatus Roizmanbacteria bacterium]
MQTKTLIELVGWYGVVVILIAYFLVSFNFIEANTLSYQLMNLTGAMGILAVSWYKRVYQTVVTNTFWIAIAIIALLQIIPRI